MLTFLKGILQIYLEFWNSTNPPIEYVPDIPDYTQVQVSSIQQCQHIISETLHLLNFVKSHSHFPNFSNIESVEKIDKLNYDGQFGQQTHTHSHHQTMIYNLNKMKISFSRNLLILLQKSLQMGKTLNHQNLQQTHNLCPNKMKSIRRKNGFQNYQNFTIHVLHLFQE